VLEPLKKSKIQAETLRYPANLMKPRQNAKQVTFTSGLKQVLSITMTMIGVDYVSASTYSQKRMPIRIEAKPSAWLLLRTVTQKIKAQN
jgi:hypothetical protein